MDPFALNAHSNNGKKEEAMASSDTTRTLETSEPTSSIEPPPPLNAPVANSAAATEPVGVSSPVSLNLLSSPPFPTAEAAESDEGNRETTAATGSHAAKKPPAGAPPAKKASSRAKRGAARHAAPTEPASDTAVSVPSADDAVEHASPETSDSPDHESPMTSPASSSSTKQAGNKRARPAQGSSETHKRAKVAQTETAQVDTATEEQLPLLPREPSPATPGASETIAPPIATASAPMEPVAPTHTTETQRTAAPPTGTSGPSPPSPPNTDALLHPPALAVATPSAEPVSPSTTSPSATATAHTTTTSCSLGRHRHSGPSGSVATTAANPSPPPPFESLRSLTMNVAGVNIAALLADSGSSPPVFSRRLTTRRAKRRPTLFADHPQFLQHRELRAVVRARRGPNATAAAAGAPGAGTGAGAGGGQTGNTLHGMVMGSHGHLYPPFFASPFATDEDVLHTLNEWTDSVPLVYAALLWKYTPHAFLASAMEHSPRVTKREPGSDTTAPCAADASVVPDAHRSSPVKQEKPCGDDEDDA